MRLMDFRSVGIRAISPKVASPSDGISWFSPTQPTPGKSVRVGMRSGSELLKMVGPAARTTDAACSGSTSMVETWS